MVNEFAYPAISTSTNLGIDIRLKYNIPGVGNQHSQRCNQPNYVAYCPDCKHTEVHSYHCNRWDCPVCYPWTAAKAARRIRYRIEGSYGALKNAGLNPGFLNHVVFSPPPSEYEGFDYKIQKKEALKYAKQVGMSGAVVVFHPYRVKDEVDDFIGDLRDAGLRGGTWQHIHDNIFKGASDVNLGIDFQHWSDYIEFAPHWHLIGFFHLKEKSDVFYDRTGWIYNNVSMEKHHKELDWAGLFRTVRYLLTHHYVEKGKQSVTYFGNLSPNKIIHESVSIRVPVKCPDCYVEYAVVDFDNNVTGCVTRGELYKIPVKTSWEVDELLEDIANRRFKFDPKKYDKLWKFELIHSYRVRTVFKVNKKKCIVKKVSSAVYSYCNRKKYYL